MRFFIPAAKNTDQEQNVYSAIRQFVSEEMGAHLSERMVFKLAYVHEGKKHYAEVGERCDINGEPVVAILYEDMRRLYYVCTTYRGVARDIPILVGANEVRDVEDFDQYSGPIGPLPRSEQ